MSFEALSVSTGVVLLGEMGDKTQLLALLLAARYRRPWLIAFGILIATLANHAAASALGAWLTGIVDPQWMRWGLGLSFLAVAAWMLIPDKLDENEAAAPSTGVCDGSGVCAAQAVSSRQMPSSSGRIMARPASAVCARRR